MFVFKIRTRKHTNKKSHDQFASGARIAYGREMKKQAPNEILKLVFKMN